MPVELSRREFLKLAATAAGGLAANEAAKKLGLGTARAEAVQSEADTKQEPQIDLPAKTFLTGESLWDSLRLFFDSVHANL